jgi:CheY-like chemotaxis protein
MPNDASTNERAVLRVFLVDDEVLIRMMVSDMLEDLGHVVVAEAGELNQSLRLARSADYDIAVLDVNLNGKMIDPVAEAISARRIPFILATGYSSPSLATKYAQFPRLRKPYGVRDLEIAIDQARATTRGGGSNALRA